MSRKRRQVAPFVLPTHVMVRGRRWRVRRWRDLNHAERSKMERARLAGWTHYWSHEIWLGRHATPRAEAQTFLHELLHACCDLEPSRSLHERAEERLVSNVERPLFRALEALRWK